VFCSLDDRRLLVHHEGLDFAGRSTLDWGKDLEYMFTYFYHLFSVYTLKQNVPLIYTLSFYFNSIESINILSIFETHVL